MVEVVMNEVLRSYNGKRVFITGHTGFKGSWLAFLLSELGADVTGYALPPSSKNSHFDQLKLRDQITHLEGDIRDQEHLHKSLQKSEPEFVFHFAAQALVRPSYEDPASTFSTNILGSANLLDSIRQCESVRSLIYVTSDKCYENLEWIWGYRECDQLGGQDPYSASKAAAEIIFSSYTRSFFQNRSQLGTASVRAGNVIGGGDWAIDRIVPDCIRAIQAQTSVKLRNPNATRPWQHVLEPLSGYLLLAKKLYEDPKKWHGAWNFGPSSREVQTVKNVADILVDHIGQGSVEILENNEQVHEAQLLQLNCDKAHQLLNWYPRWDVSKTLEATALWYKHIINGGDARQITWAQIQDFYPELL